MRSEQLFMMLSGVSPEYIAQADRQGRRASALSRIRVIASLAAACLVLSMAVTYMFRFVPNEYELDYERYVNQTTLEKESLWIYYADGNNVKKEYVKLPVSEKNVFEVWKHLCGIESDIELILCTEHKDEAEGYAGYRLSLVIDDKEYYFVFSDGMAEYFDGDADNKLLESFEKTYGEYFARFDPVSFGTSSEEDDDITDTDDVTTDPETSINAPVELPDYDGYIFTVLSTGTEPYSDFGYEENSTNVVDRAQYAREQAMLLTLNLKLETITRVDSKTRSTGAGYKAINNDYIIGQRNYDMAMVSPYDAAALAYTDLLSDINKMPYIDTSSSCWDQGAVRDLGVYDSLFYINGWVSASNVYQTNVIYMNLTLDYAYGLGIRDRVLSAVNNGSWTLDKLAQYVKEGDESSQLNLGMSVSYSSIHAAMQGGGDKLLVPDKNDGYRLTLGEGAAKTAFTKYTDIIYSDRVMIFETDKDALDKFSFGKTLFGTGTIGDAKLLYQRMDKEADDGYLILPYPKLSESQKEYKTSLSMAKAQYICFPKYLYNREMSGIVAQTLCTVGAEVVKPALYAQTLSYIKADSSYSTYILQTIFGSYTHDQGYHLAIADYDITLEQLVSSKSKSYASQMSQSVVRADVQLKNLIDQYKMWR